MKKPRFHVGRYSRHTTCLESFVITLPCILNATKVHFRDWAGRFTTDPGSIRMAILGILVIFRIKSDVARLSIRFPATDSIWLRTQQAPLVRRANATIVFDVYPSTSTQVAGRSLLNIDRDRRKSVSQVMNALIKKLCTPRKNVHQEGSYRAVEFHNYKGNRKVKFLYS